MSTVTDKPASPLRSAELARLAEVSPDTLRHYEAKGLLQRPRRSTNGYREYPMEALARVRLVRRAVSLGFSLEELARIIKVRDEGGAPCREVRAIAAAKLAMLEERVSELQRACDRLRSVLDRWDDLLDKTPKGKRAALLDALEGFVEPGSPSPILPIGLRRRVAS